MHGVGSSGIAHIPQGPKACPYKPFKIYLFISPPSKPLGGIHDMHTQEEATQVGSGGGDGDEDDDLTKYMVYFPKSRCVTINVPLRQVKVPDNS